MAFGIVEEQAPLFTGHSHDDQDITSPEEKPQWPRHLSLHRCLACGAIIQIILLAIYTAASFAIIQRALDTNSDPDIHGEQHSGVRP